MNESGLGFGFSRVALGKLNAQLARTVSRLEPLN
jgi:hypothetical protein